MHRVSIERSAKGSLIIIEGIGEFASPLEPDKLPLDGAELSEEEVEAFVASLDKAALAFGAKMLAMRLMTRGMLVKRMVEAGYDEGSAARAAERFEELGAMDDEDYARMFAEDRKLRGWGSVRIRAELKRREVDENIIDTVLDELGDSSAAIEDFIRRRTGGNAIDRHTADKIGAALVRKGFRWDEIRPVLRKYTSYDYD